MKKNKKTILWVVVLLLVTNILTFIGTNYILVAAGDKVVINKGDYNLLKDYSKLFVVRDLLKKEYVDPIDEDKLVEGAVRGMVAGVGDPYTEYMNPEEYSASTAQLEGEYAGIGLTVTLVDGKLTAVSAMEGTPSAKAGIKPYDVIIAIDGKDISNKTLNESVALIKGKEGTEVVLTIVKKGTTKPVEVPMKREKIVLNPVKSEMLEDQIGYIRLTTFNQLNAASSFQKALDDLEKKNMNGLIIDLRDNGGGLLQECVKITDSLVGEGTIVYTIDNKGRKEVIPSDKNKVDVPIVVLVNGGTASASEILSGAIKDLKAGTLVGTRTFGKGLVQNIIPLKADNSAVKVTIERYYTPSGVCIQGKGIEPDVVVELPDELKDKTTLTRSEDVQFKKAVEVIKGQIH